MTDAVADFPVIGLDVLGDLDDPLGSGGQASVYELDNRFPDLLLKRYRSEVAVDGGVLDELVAWRRSLDTPQREFLDERTCWPLSRVTDDDATVGVIIRRAPAPYSVTLKSGNVKLRELQYLFLLERSKKVGIDTPEPVDRARVVGQLAELLAFFSRHRVVHGDLSMKNILWHKPTVDLSAVFVLDCDGVRIGDSPAALPHVTTPGWTDPRIVKGLTKAPDAESDLYALALTFYRCYYGHLGELDAFSDTLRLPSWPPAPTELMQLTAKTLAQKGSRPTAEAWVAGLGELIVQLSDPEHDIGKQYRSGPAPVPASGDERPERIVFDPDISKTKKGKVQVPSTSAGPLPPPPGPSPSAPADRPPVLTGQLDDAGGGKRMRVVLASSIGLLIGALLALIVVLVFLT